MKRKKIKDLNIRSMLNLIAMVDNDFIPNNAALDLNTRPGNVSYQMRRIENSFDYDFFIWGKRKPSHTRIHPLALTEQGYAFYRSVVWFTTSAAITNKDLL